MKTKKLLSALVSIAILANALLFTVVYADDAVPSGNVEISFKVGDDTLSINGKNVTVEKPYIVNGTTLVPLRVITEAFGADVDWNGGEKKITLTYDTVVIILHVGSKIATVNGQEQELLEAPELPYDTTMVPLRFITENFGADVRFNPVDDSIKVVKEFIANTDTALIGKLDKERIGDSYYGWSIKTPKNMAVTDQEFDGTYYKFSTDDDNISLVVSIYPVLDKQATLDSYMVKAQEGISENFTMVKSNKSTDSNGNEYVQFQYKSKTFFFDERTYLKNNLAYEVYVKTDLEKVSAEQRDEYVSFLSTFMLSFSDKNSTEDLSSVGADGFRKFEDKTYKISFSVPADWYQRELSSENEFLFYKMDVENYDEDQRNDIGGVNLSIYSIDGEKNAAYYANRDKQFKHDFYNPSITTVSDITNITLNDIDAMYYTANFAMPDNTRRYVTDIFFDNGDYCYNLSIQTMNRLPNAKSVEEKIKTSFNCEKLDKKEIGELANADIPVYSALTKNHKYSNEKVSFDVPVFFTQTSYDDKYFYCSSTDSAVGFSTVNLDEASDREVTSRIDYVTKSMKNDGAIFISNSSRVTIGKNNGYKFKARLNPGKYNESIQTTYIFRKDSKMYVFSAIIATEFSDNKMDTIIEKTMETITFN